MTAYSFSEVEDVLISVVSVNLKGEKEDEDLQDKQDSQETVKHFYYHCPTAHCRHQICCITKETGEQGFSGTLSLSEALSYSIF